MRRALAIGVFLLASLPALASAAKVKGPVAVLPFNNISDNPDLAWMSSGISETLLSDIERSGKLRVVERDQIDSAISELAFQNTKAIDAGSASAVGRIVGAQTVVVGGYQRAGKDLRITARFVSVETGVVLETAKVTGKTVRIFELQDQIVRKLLNLAPPPKKPIKGTRKPVKRRPPTENTVKAYKLYAMSLNAATDANSRGFLVAALEVDPSFHYATEDLEALEGRMRKYRENAMKLMDEEERKVRTLLDDPEQPELARAGHARMLYVKLLTTSRYSAMLELGQHVYGMEWRTPEAKPIRAEALEWQYRAYAALGQYDRALQVGEHFLQEFPTHMTRSVTEALMRSWIMEKANREKGRKALPAKLAEIEQNLVNLRTGATPPEDWRVMILEAQRCYAMSQNYAYSRAITECGQFLAKYRHLQKHEHGGIAYRTARFHHVTAHKNAGRYDEARRLALEFIRDEPDFCRDMYLEGQMAQWPR